MQSAVCVYRHALRVPLGTRRVGTARIACQAVSCVKMKPNAATSVEATSTYRMAYALPIVQSVHRFSLPLISVVCPFIHIHTSTQKRHNVVIQCKVLKCTTNTSSSLHNVHKVNGQQFECHLCP